MGVYFSNEFYFNKALELAKSRPQSRISTEDAFLLLLKGSSEAQIDNLIAEVRRSYPQLTADEIYGHIRGTEHTAVGTDKILRCAYAVLERQQKLGNETAPGTNSNTSSWIAHCLWEAKLCAQLAGPLGLDEDTAFRLGLLHDIGRRVTHRFEHTVRGFEMLADAGADAEALGCLTHSFIRGGRCASNERAEPGFYVSGEGLPCWKENSERDHLTQFLEVCAYTPYDMVLNMADLMATSSGIVPPAERIRDIATRRTIDPVNRGYFLAELITLCEQWLDPSVTVRFTEGCTIEQMEERLEEVSGSFWEQYNSHL